MTALESPLEALAFNYMSFGVFTVVNSIWTWLAVVTAAFSFWRIETSSSALLLKPATRGEFSDVATPLSSLSSDERVPLGDECTSTFEKPLKTANYATTVSSLDQEQGTKGRFITYLEDNILGTCDGEENVEEDNMSGESKILSQWRQNTICLSLSDCVETEELCNDWYECWERVIRTREGEMGWYNYQDRMVIDGNVIKLWEGCRRRREAEATVLFGGVVRTW